MISEPPPMRRNAALMICFTETGVETVDPDDWATRCRRGLNSCPLRLWPEALINTEY